MEKRSYDTTVARIAGNIMSGLADRVIEDNREKVVEGAVRIARLIVEEVKRTELARPPLTPDEERKAQRLSDLLQNASPAVWRAFNEFVDAGLRAAYKDTPTVAPEKP
jgi:hypothetical protein